MIAKEPDVSRSVVSLPAHNFGGLTKGTQVRVRVKWIGVVAEVDTIA